MKSVIRKFWVENKCPSKDESTRKMLLDILRRGVTPLRIAICATYWGGHLACMVVLHIMCYVFGKAD